jgi:hypothetical protein
MCRVIVAHSRDSSGLEYASHLSKRASWFAKVTGERVGKHDVKARVEKGQRVDVCFFKPDIAHTAATSQSASFIKHLRSGVDAHNFTWCNTFRQV